MPYSYPRESRTRQVETRHLSSRHPSMLLELSGTTEHVILEAADMLARDTHTDHYAHMALSVVAIDTSQPGRLTIRLYKNLYAGD